MPEELLTIALRPDRDHVVVAARGELDRFTAAALRAAIDELVGSGWSDIVIDLRQLTFMDSGGVHLLEELRDAHFSPTRFSMIDGTGPAALPLALMGGPRLLPAHRSAPDEVRERRLPLAGAADLECAWASVG